MPENENFSKDIKKIAEFIDYTIFNKIINKLTDYAEVIPTGKLSGIVNFSFNFDSSQSNTIIKLLLKIQALSKINSIASKGSKHLDEEFISNIFSDTTNPENLSSYINLRNILENKLSHQTQLYNMNMNKNDTTTSMPLSELHGHVITYKNLGKSDLTISSKAYHGYISSTLHDAYTTLINRTDWWNDLTYIKFFFNEDDAERKNNLLVSRKPRLSLTEINNNIREVLNHLSEIEYSKMQATLDEDKINKDEDLTFETDNTQSQAFNDKMLLTPFGRQYGLKIDKIIFNIFDPIKSGMFNGVSGEAIQERILSLYEIFNNSPETLNLPDYSEDIITIVDFLLQQGHGIKGLAEKYLYTNKKESFSKFYSEEKKVNVELFAVHLFMRYFEEQFSALFRIIKSLDLKKFACAYIMKRIYLIEGENLTTFGYFLVQAIGKVGKIKV